MKSIDNIILVWNKLNGYKTTIGAALLLIANIIVELNSIWHFPVTWIPELVATIRLFGSLTTGVGLLHKGKKQLSKN